MISVFEIISSSEHPFTLMVRLTNCGWEYDFLSGTFVWLGPVYE